MLALAFAARTARCADEEFFESKVRPILVERCQTCHGEKKQKSGLRLDSHEAVLKGGEGGLVLVPGHPEKSRLIEAIHWGNEDLKMPPKEKLKPAEIAVLEDWVKRGAPWGNQVKVAVAKPANTFDLEQRKQQHWAWKPIQPQSAPPVKSAAWCRGDIDRFILARLEEKSLSPAPETDRRTWIRRVYFDLIGLPPKPAEVQAFIADASPEAYEKVADHLLASQHFGERWARHWLDLVRYAETRGHEFDPLIPGAWEYRDYVIRALNADVPYDQFIREHLAGDLLEKPRVNKQGWNESILGTGFWFLGEELHSPVDIRQDETDRLDNRVDTMGKAILGLTVGCARCHDHKFDAIAQKDYYSLEGFLLSSTYRQVRFETIETEKRIAGDLEILRQESAPKLLSTIARAERRSLSPSRIEQANAREPMPIPTTRPSFPQTIIADFQTLPDEQWHANGYTFGTGPVRAGEVVLGDSANHPIAEIAPLGMARRDSASNALKITSEEHEYGTLGSWDRTGKTVRTPKVTLESGKVWYLVRGAGRAYASVDSHLMVNGPLHAQVLHEWKGDGDKWQWVRHDLTPYKGHRVEVEFSPVGEGLLAIAKVVEAEQRPPLDRPATSADPAARQQLLERTLEGMEQGKVPQGLEWVADWACRNLDVLVDEEGMKEIADVASPILARRAELIAQIPTASRSAPAMWDGNGVDECILKRGQYKTPGDLAPRQLLQAIGGDNQGSFGPDSGRLHLAEQVLAENDPFPARVMVNRVWQHLFGVGIVATVDNFGLLGARPTHPELLDYLADSFRKDGWSIKRLIRQIVLSSAYRMSSGGDARAEEIDPQNLLVHRMNVKRLEGEAIRDAILGVSGRLDEKVYGPSVEVFVTEFMEGRGRPGGGPLDGAGRRSIYIRTRRNFLSPMMLAFDVPIPFQCIGRRSVSNVPAQALILMNEPFVVGQAGVWGKRVAATPGSWSERIGQMYEQAFARPSTPAEMRDAMDFIADAKRAYGAEDQRVWSEFADVLFNVKEFIFVR
jgi:hypothetical protein